MKPLAQLLIVCAVWMGVPASAMGQTEGCFPGQVEAKSAYQAKRENPVSPLPGNAQRLKGAYPVASGTARMEATTACGTIDEEAFEKTARQTSFEIRHRDALRRLEMRRRQSSDRIEANSQQLPIERPTEPAPEVRCGELGDRPATLQQAPVNELPSKLMGSPHVYPRRRTTPQSMGTVGCLPGSLPNDSQANQLTVPRATTNRNSAANAAVDLERFRRGPIVSAARPANIRTQSSTPTARFSPPKTVKPGTVGQARFAVTRPEPVSARGPNLVPLPLAPKVAQRKASPAAMLSKVQLVQATEEILIPEPYDSTLDSPLGGASVDIGTSVDRDLSTATSPCESVGDGPNGSPCDAPASTLPEFSDFSNQVVINPFEQTETPVRSPMVGATTQTLAEMRLGEVFNRLESLPDKFVPSPNTNPRNPYTGSAEQFGFRWTPRNLAHRTLYFEDMPLERYGLTRGWYKQMFASAKEFFYDAAVMPLRWGKEVKCDLHYTLGHERAGSCPPRIEERACPVP
ncbi:MAG: hypothetical protein AAF497_03555 [Planctomycetota bacterium]